MSDYHTDNQFSDETKTKGNPPVKPKNKDVRPREHLTKDEVELLLQAAKKDKRYGARNYALILTLYKHGLRASEAADLRWENLDLKAGTLLVQRKKGGKDSTHPVGRDELQALKRIREQNASGFIFKSSRQPCLSERAIHRIVAEAGEAAGISFPIHPHMLRHACGYQLANLGTDTRTIQGFLGHASITSTVIYTELSPNRFKGLADKL
jgi:type 1 fimbriae regulatory protein FimB/type 1 fimbriae regulatory protein FimE